MLESGGGIGETKEHHSWFKESFMGDKGGFPLMPVFDSDIIVPPSNIKFGEDFCPLEFIDEVGNEWERVCIMDSVFVNIAIVLAGSKTTVFLLDKEERGCLWRVGGADFAGSKIFIEKVLCRFSFFRREGVYFADFRFEGFIKINLMIIGMERRNMICDFF